jgi:hypothetical protein
MGDRHAATDMFPGVHRAKLNPGCERDRASTKGVASHEVRAWTAPFHRPSGIADVNLAPVPAIESVGPVDFEDLNSCVLDDTVDRDPWEPVHSMHTLGQDRP